MRSVVEVEIKAPLAKTAALFADPALYIKWMDDMAPVEPISGQLGMPGSKFRLIPKKGNMAFVATVLERNLPAEFHLRLDAKNVTIDTRGKLTALSSSATCLVHEQVFDFRGLFKLLGWVAGPAMRKAQRAHMEGFKRFAESQA